MRKFLLFAMLLLALAGCSEPEGSGGEVIARINDYELTRDEFFKRLAEEARYYDHMNMDRGVREAYLEQAIRKELLIQEAVNRKLDREEKFMRAIERFWENTLIRDVLEQQSKELEKEVFVSEEEMLAYYGELKAQNPDTPPFDDMRDRIRDTLYGEKVTRAIDQWVDDLRSQANIEVNEKLLDVTEGGEGQ